VSTPTPSPVEKLIKDVTGKSIKLSTIIPTLQPKVQAKAATVKDYEKLEKKPLQLKPGQKKLNSTQLKQIQGLNDKQSTSAQMTPQIKLAGYKRIEDRDKQVAQEVKAATRTKLKPGYKEPGIGGSFVESAQQGTAQALSSFGATGEMIGNSTGLLFLSEGGAKIRKKFDKFIASNPELNAPDNMSWKDPRMYSRLAGAAIPSLLGGVIAAIGGTVAAGGNPVGGAVSAAAYGYSLNAGSTYQEAKKSGVGEAESFIKGNTVGTINGILESLTPSKIVNKIPASAKKEISKSLVKFIAQQAKKRGIKILENGTLEGTTEAIQQVVSNAVAQSYDKNRKLWDGIAENFVGGFLGGGAAGTFEGDIKVNKTDLLESLPDGETTPQEIIGAVIASGQQDTSQGKELIKSAVEAREAGQNVVINKTPEQIEEDEIQESLLNSDIAKEEETKATPKTEKATEDIKDIQENQEMRRQENEAKKSILEQFTGDQIKAMRTIKQSMESRENKGKDAITVEELPSYQKNIHDVMSAIGTNSTDEALRFIREDLPSPLVNASTRAELEQIKVLKSHITPKEVEVPRNQLPVGEGERLVSRHAANMKNFIGKANQEQIDELGLSTYNKMNDDKIIAKAAEYVTNNRKEAMDVLLGKKEAPAGLFPEVIYVAMINSKDAKTDMSLATALASLQATALGQRLQILSQIDKNNPIKILNKIYKIIEGDVMARNKGKSIKEIQTKNVKDMNSKVVKPNKGDWFAFVDSLQC
jgi:hypothetical protein